jgi:hypothetical protein
MVTSTQLFAAAGTISATATAASQLASTTADGVLRDLRRQTAGRLHDCACQVLVWARAVRYVEERDERMPPAMARRIEAATREFLTMAEG